MLQYNRLNCKKEAIALKKSHKVILWVCNILLMALAIATSFLYANNIRHQQISTKQSDFISTVESMKSV